MKRMESPLRRRHFIEEEPIHALDFLVRFMHKFNIQQMSQVQAFDTLPPFLEGFALSQ